MHRACLYIILVALLALGWLLLEAGAQPELPPMARELLCRALHCQADELVMKPAEAARPHSRWHRRRRSRPGSDGWSWTALPDPPFEVIETLPQVRRFPAPLIHFEFQRAGQLTVDQILSEGHAVMLVAQEFP